MGATFTEQVIVVAGLVIIVALIAFIVGIWYGAGRNAELVAGLENELEVMRGPFGPMPPEIAHEVPPPLIVSEDPASLAYWRSLDHDPEACTRVLTDEGQELAAVQADTRAALARWISSSQSYR